MRVAKLDTCIRETLNTDVLTAEEDVLVNKDTGSKEVEVEVEVEKLKEAKLVVEVDILVPSSI